MEYSFVTKNPRSESNCCPKHPDLNPHHCRINEYFHKRLAEKGHVTRFFTLGFFVKQHPPRPLIHATKFVRIAKKCDKGKLSLMKLFSQWQAVFEFKGVQRSHFCLQEEKLIQHSFTLCDKKNFKGVGIP
jgi:hypothetical protein